MSCLRAIERGPGGARAPAPSLRLRHETLSAVPTRREEVYATPICPAVGPHEAH